MRNYKIYLKGNTDTRKTDITAGGNEYVNISIMVGKGKSTSHHVGDLSIRCREDSNNVLTFYINSPGNRVVHLEDGEFREEVIR